MRYLWHMLLIQSLQHNMHAIRNNSFVHLEGFDQLRQCYHPATNPQASQFSSPDISILQLPRYFLQFEQRMRARVEYDSVLCPLGPDPDSVRLSRGRLERQCADHGGRLLGQATRRVQVSRERLHPLQPLVSRSVSAGVAAKF